VDTISVERRIVIVIPGPTFVVKISVEFHVFHCTLDVFFLLLFELALSLCNSSLKFWDVLLVILFSCFVHGFEEVVHSVASQRGYANRLLRISGCSRQVGSDFTNLEMLIELIEDEGHAVHKTVHVGGFTIAIAGVGVGSKGCLEGLEILHPIESKVVFFDIGLVEDEDEG
jgi:hypothetical protein